MPTTASRDDLVAAMRSAAVIFRDIGRRAKQGQHVNPDTVARAAKSLEEIAARPPADGLTYFELRRGTPDDLMPLVLGQYTAMEDATEHGLDAYGDAFGHADRLTWYPADDTETVHHLYATTDGDEVQTEWHVVTRTIDASYDPDAEG